VAARTRPFIRRLTRRPALTAYAGASALALGFALTAAAPAAAAPAGPATPKPVKLTHPAADHMGSTIPAHETTQHVTLKQVTPALPATVPGMDVSGYQGNVNWPTAYGNGARFAYVKATESTSYTNPYFTQQYNGSYNAGMIRGAYHFAVPNNSGGATQADYFVAHGGGWSGDGKTLPPMLDIEYNPYGATCYGLSQASMVSWIKAFSDEVHAKTGRWVTIYTTNDWWTSCTGNQGDFSSTNPLFVARYASSAGTLPYKWGVYTFWQFADSGTFPGDQDVFNGALDRLQALAKG
jgi:GH25 family lysozyme M1 (1,4-beta-N-acetylmuramidase)